MMAEFGLSTLDDLSANILESSRAAVLAEIARLPRGSWRYEMTIDGYDRPITLATTTTIAEDAVRVDFAGNESPTPNFGFPTGGWTDQRDREPFALQSAFGGRP
jgi:N-methylhydantoinase B